MKKIFSVISCTLIMLILLTVFAPAAGAVKHTVVKGDSLWKIAVGYQVGLYEIISANPQLENPALIYPGDIIEVPLYDTDTLAYENEVIRLVNEKRAANGLPALKRNWQLSRVARYKSLDMHDNRYFSHNSPIYGTPFKMMRDFGISFNAAAENIAMGQRTPAEVVNAWWNSSGHRKNILGAAYTETGVGYVADGNYWTQQFTG